MILSPIHTRARKKRDRAEAQLLRKQVAVMRKDRQASDENKPLWRQPESAVSGLPQTPTARRYCNAVGWFC